MKPVTGNTSGLKISLLYILCNIQKYPVFTKIAGKFSILAKKFGNKSQKQCIKKETVLRNHL